MKVFFTLIMIVALISISIANASQIINYQGKISDSDGDPVADGDYQMIFTIYDAGGASQWSSDVQDVFVSNGLFNYSLGSVVLIPDNIFENSNLYLGIKIGDDPEMSPKTLLTSVPRAAVAHNLSGGSIETKTGCIALKNENGDSAIVFIADADHSLIRVFPPDDCVPPEPCLPGIEIGVNIKNRIDMHLPGAEAEAGVLQLVVSEDEGGFISIHSSNPICATKVKLGGSPTDTGYVTLYGGIHKSEYRLIEMKSHTNTGGSMSFFDPDNIDGREILSMGAAPGTGGSCVMFNPQPEPPGQVGIEMTTNSAKGPGGHIAVYNTDSLSTSLQGGMLELKDPTISGNPNVMMEINSNYSQFNMVGVSPPLGGEPPVISMMVDDDSAKVGIGTGSPVEALHVVGNIALTGEVIVVTDTKLKTNIRPIDNAVEMVNNLNGVRYNFLHNEYPEMKLPERDQVGLLAQDVEKVLPELVFEDGKGTKYVAYSKLTAVLIEAIKEQQETISELQERIEKLEKQ